MRPVSLHDKAEIVTFLRKKPWLHLYHLGDLDDFFWPYTMWYGSKRDGEIEQLVLLYTGLDDPVILAISEEAEAMCSLLKSIMHLLPRRIYSHLSEGVAEAFADDYHIEPNGQYYKMLLTDPAQLDTVDTSSVVGVSTADQAGIEQLFADSYPGNWFDPRMLETGQYYGVRQGDQWTSVGGVHVYSPEYRVAALGNVTTHPDSRGQGLATATCAKLCQELQATTDYIGLNVNQSNTSAIHCYQRLGFEQKAVYGEYMLTLKSIADSR
jgi:ribosomal protein S18 acetylase RimI-like enzyme